MLRLLLCCLAAAVMLVGCGDSSDSASTNAAKTETSTTPAKTTTTPAPIKNPFKKPAYPPAHPGEKVELLKVKDIKRGTGPAIRVGDTGFFDFIGMNYATGKPLDDSWGKKRPFSTVIDTGVVIAGWAQGIPGMRVGGRRQLVVPKALGFTQNPDASVRNNATYFDVVLLGIERAEPAGVGGGSGGS
ncbi:MAG: FKBP-type peptidyl-prolyl cis-trans isomerase [Conexibacter sp.]